MIKNFEVNHAKSVGACRVAALDQRLVDLSLAKSVVHDVAHVVNQVDPLHVDLPLNFELVYLEDLAAVFHQLFRRGQIEGKGMNLVENHEVFV